MVRFEATTRTIIDGRTDGFWKLIVDRATAEILGCHVVGERAVEIVQVAAIDEDAVHVSPIATPLPEPATPPARPAGVAQRCSADARGAKTVQP